MKRVKIADLKVEKRFSFRLELSEDAITRYMDLYRSGKEKPIKASKTNIVVDGFHRIEACKRLGVETILVDYVEVEDSDLLTESWKLNWNYGVPPTKIERDKYIVRQVTEFGKTPQQVSVTAGLSPRRIYQIIGSEIISKTDNRRKLTDANKTAIAKLLIAKETQENVAKFFAVAQSTISEVWAKIRDNIYQLYVEEQLLKKEVAEKTNLSSDEVDKILQEFGDPLNFESQTSTWWPSFGLDNRFGKKHATNLPAELVRNIFALYTKPGDIILDPAAGGGVTIDVAEDMVSRTCYGYDLNPARPDIKQHDLNDGSPSLQSEPNLIFLDLPYGPQKKQEYSTHKNDLANLTIPNYLAALSKIFNYWSSGTLVVLMSSYRGSEGFMDLPNKAENLMEAAGWMIKEHIVNGHGRIASETGFWIEKAKKERWLLRKHIHILVGTK